MENGQEVDVRVKMCMDGAGLLEGISTLLPIRFCPMCGSPAKELHVVQETWYVDRNSEGGQDVCCYGPETRSAEEIHYIYTEFGILEDE